MQSIVRNFEICYSVDVDEKSEMLFRFYAFLHVENYLNNVSFASHANGACRWVKVRVIRIELSIQLKVKLTR